MRDADLRTRRVAVVELLTEHGQLCDRQIAERLGWARSMAGAVRRSLLADGLVEQVDAPPGAHYPIAGWRLVSRTDEITSAHRARRAR